MAKSAVARASGQEKLIRLQNLSNDVPQVVYDALGEYGPPNRRYEIPAGTVQYMPEPIAERFLLERAKYVSIFEEHAMPQRHGEPLVWLANGTGNPWLPVTVGVERIEEGKKKTIQVPNPLATPTIVKRLMQGGTEVVLTPRGDDKMSIRLPDMRFQFAPYSRRPIAQSLADWNLERDLKQEPQHRGKLILTREPTSFEPNETWGYNELQTWAHLTAPKMFKKRIDLFGAEEKSFTSDNDMIAAKITLWSAVFHVLIDDRYNIPDRATFEPAFEHYSKLHAA